MICMAFDEFPTGLPAPKPLRLGEAALFLDLDGTLAPITGRPQDVQPDPRRSSLLSQLESALQGRLAVVSGRTLEDVDRILDRRVTAVAAVHGLVRRDPDDRLQETPAHPALTEAVQRLHAFAARDPGLIVEEKGLSATLHYRLAGAQAADARALAEDIAATTGLFLQRGDMVEELRTPGPDKGDSVAAFMARPPFAGSTPVFVGDDVTDEDGFEAANARGGYGVLIGPPRATAASFRLADVDEALAWLEAAL